MFVQMRRQEFDLLENTKLGEACFEPIIRVYKMEQNLKNDKTVFYKRLTKGQQALFMFHVYYNHANKSLSELYWWSAYFLAQPEIWSEIKVGLRYFKDDAMLLLLEEIEAVLKRHNHPSSLEEFTVSRDDLDRNQELIESINTLNAMFHKIAPLTLKRIGTHIRSNSDEFVQIKD
ncbi:hypothetical protein P9597_01880 [Aneurinibacillus migulanus]|uniref:hypothetical protein n=1 Tax=Aneurinibacillus migulanus TaxID=47500 RepID=UPI002E21E712|nr:hypothetical protein [Aneurinibacillus migulanus]